MQRLPSVLLFASTLHFLFACAAAPDEADDADEEVDDAAQAYTSCNWPELRRCQSYNGGSACYDRWCSRHGPACYTNQTYVSLGTAECKINTPGQSIPGRGLFICDTTYCSSNGRAVEQSGQRRNCRLMRCEVGTYCGDALC